MYCFNSINHLSMPEWADVLVAPSVPTVISSLPSSSNLLHVSVEHVDPHTTSQLLVATTADRRMTLLYPDEAFSLHRSYDHLQDSPILSCISVSNKPLITISSAMSGQICALRS